MKRHLSVFAALVAGPGQGDPPSPAPNQPYRCATVLLVAG
jgi:hypothetical protein